MPKQTIGMEARLIRDFDLLSPEGQRIVRDIINAKQPASKRQEARAPRTSKKGLPPTAPKPAEQKEEKAPICGACGNIKEHPDHDTEHYLGAHEFQPPKSGKRSSKKSTAATPEVGNEKAVVVGAGGD